MKRVILVVVALLVSGCAMPIMGGMTATESLEMMKAQNARGCLFIRGSATPFASAGFLAVGTWGADPPSYADCWKSLPLIP